MKQTLISRSGISSNVICNDSVQPCRYCPFLVQGVFTILKCDYMVEESMLIWYQEVSPLSDVKYDKEILKFDK